MYEKPLKEINIEGLPVIGKGNCGTVYRLDAERIIKVYDAPRYQRDTEMAKYEADISREVFKRGLPTAISFGVVKCGSYKAAIYEKITGGTLGDAILEDERKLEELVSKFAILGRQIHHTEAPREIFPDIVGAKIKRGDALLIPWTTEAELAQMRALIDAIPDRPYMVHSDFHWDNVMVQDGEIILIDVGGISHGHPIFDFVSMYLRTGSHEFAKTKLSQELSVHVFESFVKEYFGERLNKSNRKVFDELLEFLGNIPILAAHCGMNRPGECDPEVEKNVRMDLSGILENTTEEITEKFACIDRELFV